MGPLVVQPGNPRYFADSSTGEPVYLTGSHTWATLQERAYPETPDFDFSAWLSFMEGHGHNFLRLWAWEHAAWMQFTPRRIVYRPNPFLRTGPGAARDGLPRFDVTQLDPAFFDRLGSRVAAARDRGIYVSVMLFQGFSVEKKGGGDDDCGNPWHGHPFHADNNINGIDGDPDGDGQGRQVHTLNVPEITRIQEAYVRKVVETVGGFDHVLYEIGNECVGESTEWQYHMIRFLRKLEAERRMQHPVGMTFQYCATNPGTNAALFGSPADWISPNADARGEYDTRYNPPPADGSKVVVSDTDHFWGVPDPAVVRDVEQWVWKSFMRGHNPVFMDPYRDARTGPELDRCWDGVRSAMGLARKWAERIPLLEMVPDVDVSSTGYCLASAAGEYLVYQPEAGPLGLNLPVGTYRAMWGDTTSGERREGGVVESAGTPISITPPFADGSLVHVMPVPA
jgi:hypothetical protein